MTAASQQPTSIPELVRDWEARGIRYVRFELPDMHGVSRAKIVPLRHVERYAADGLNMYGGTAVLDSASSVVSGTLYNEEVSYADQLLFPDLATAAVVPWEASTARLICDGRWRSGRPQAANPRQVLKRLLERYDELGFTPRLGLEYEFYVLTLDSGEPTFGGIHIFNSLRNTYVPVIAQLLDYLPQIGIDVLTANCEYGPSQFELTYLPAIGIQAADDGFTFRNGVKQIAHQLGYNATFMTKPFADQSASGCHVHVSLISTGDGQNAFLDTTDADGLSKQCRWFIGGVLDHAAAGLALVAPSVNCYHRFKPHSFAPCNVSWGIEDRAAAVRVKATGDQNTRVESRLPTALSNPYLAIAATLAGGLLGLQEETLPDPPGEGPADAREGLPPLPQSLDIALDALEADARLCDLLGDEFITAFVTMKRHEIQRFRDHVTDWERAEYLEVY